MAVSTAYGVDVGATAVKAAAVTAQGEILAEYSCPTPLESSATVERAVLDALDIVRYQVDTGSAVGIGTPGWTSADRRCVRYSPNLPWVDEPVADRVERAVGLPVILENDADAAAWAEYRFGAAAGASSMVALILGSGVGGSIIVDGHPIRGASGRAGELGHCTYVTGGHACACGRVGCLENYASGRSLLRRAAGFFATDVELHAAARNGDARACAIYRDFGVDVGRALANVVLVLDPEVVLIGGGVSDAFDLIAPAAREALGVELGDRWNQEVPDLVQAQLGSAAGRIGCADIGRLHALSTQSLGAAT